MIDPWHAVDRGMVPYWCESSSRSAADAAWLWFAGSPLLPPAAGQATRYLRNTAAAPVPPEPLPVEQAVRRLADAGHATGLLVV
jgi:hypothetical protein